MPASQSLKRKKRSRVPNCLIQHGVREGGRKGREGKQGQMLKKLLHCTDPAQDELRCHEIGAVVKTEEDPREETVG